MSRYPPPKTSMTMEHPPLQDVFPIKKNCTFQRHVSFQAAVGVGWKVFCHPLLSGSHLGPSKKPRVKVNNLPSGLLMILVCIILLDLEI